VMRVGFLNRDPSCHPGGDLIMIEEMRRALGKIGVASGLIYGEWDARTLEAYDLIAIYHVNFTWSRANFCGVWNVGKPFVVVPIFYPTGDLGMSFGEIRAWLEKAKAVCPLSLGEANEIRRMTGFDGFHIIPHGTDARFHAGDANGERGYVMTANARGDKGEHVVEKVCHELRIPYHYVRNVPHRNLHPHYQRAKVFVHSSPDDRMSLTVGESLCAGCRVISSVYDRGNEWFDGLATFDPHDERSLREWLVPAWHDGSWNYQPNAIAREMTWAKAAIRMKAVYQEALK
jgi:hypothetical protein